MLNIFRKNEGFTLMEILVTAAISTIGVTTAFVLLSASYRFVARGSDVNEVKQGARVAIERMLKEIRETARETLVFAGEDYSGISFASAKNSLGEFEIGEDGNPLWQKAIVYYHLPSSSEVYRYETAKTDWEYNFDPIDAISNGYGTVVARDISSIQFSLTGDKLLNIDITAVKDSSAGAEHTTNLNSYAVVRNTLQ